MRAFLGACLRIAGRLEHPLQPSMEQMLQATLLVRLDERGGGGRLGR